MLIFFNFNVIFIIRLYLGILCIIYKTQYKLDENFQQNNY